MFNDGGQFLAGNLEYNYYEGDWNAIPYFGFFPIVASGKTPNIDLSVRRAGVNDYFGFVWKGYLKLDTPGDYTFETISDDGSKFYFNSAFDYYMVPAVNNDGLHGDSSVSTVIHIPAAGIYPISLGYFDKYGSETMKLYYSGPGISRREIPSSAFVARPADDIAPGLPMNPRILSATGNSITLKWDAATDNQMVTGYIVRMNSNIRYTTTGTEFTINNLVPGTDYGFDMVAVDQAGNNSGLSATVFYTPAPIANTGLKYRYFEGDWNTLPNFNALTPVKKGIVPTVDVNVRIFADYFGIIYEGKLNAPAAGQYTFELQSDDGSRLYFNMPYSINATPTIDNDGLHGDGTYPSATVNVPAAGTYPITVTYFEKWGGESLHLYWKAPGRAREEIPAAFFSHDPDPAFQSAGSNLVAGVAQQTEVSGEGLSRVYPNPFVDRVNIEFVNSIANSTVGVDVFDVRGKRVYNQSFAKMPAGRNLMNVNIKGIKLPAGVYMMKLSVNGVPSKVMQLVKTDK